MDFSSEYIKMCEKAVEIQKLHKIEVGNFVIWTFSREDGVLVIGGSEGDLCLEGHYRLPDDFENEHIWLPRQDQLQEMIGDFKFCFNEMSRRHGTYSEFAKDFLFEEYIGENDTSSKDGDEWAKSYEQLWLMIVMKIKYNKTWNGEDWEVIK